MTRYEAAALLNACLDRVTEVTDELRRLMAEFETELAILKGRVDGLEAKVGELEATSSPPPPNSRVKRLTSLVPSILKLIQTKLPTTLSVFRMTIALP